MSREIIKNLPLSGPSYAPEPVLAAGVTPGVDAGVAVAEASFAANAADAFASSDDFYAARALASADAADALAAAESFASWAAFSAAYESARAAFASAAAFTASAADYAEAATALA